MTLASEVDLQEFLTREHHGYTWWAWRERDERDRCAFARARA